MKALNFIILFIFLISCADDTTNKNKDITKKRSSLKQGCEEYIRKNKQNNLNISILIDLSDRIEEDITIQKDTAYLASLAKVFVNHVKTKRVLLLEDKIQLFFNPEPSDVLINELSNNLKQRFTKNSTKEELSRIVEIYKKEPIRLYQITKEEAKSSKKYPGSDIWRFFKDDVKDYCIDDCHRNILVILTDGYMYHQNTKMKEKNKTSYLTPSSLSTLKLNKSNWKNKFEDINYGFIPANSDLDNLEVLVLGINSKNPNNPYALDIIELYWSDWFENMGVQKYKIKKLDISSSIEKVIADFIN